jgi:hypothetical protein
MHLSLADPHKILISTSNMLLLVQNIAPNKNKMLLSNTFKSSCIMLLINLLAVRILFLASCDVTEIGGQSGLQQLGTVLLTEQRRLWAKAIS